MSLESALRYVASSPEAPEGLATYRCCQGRVEFGEPLPMLVEEEHVPFLYALERAPRVPVASKRMQWYVHPMHKVVDEGGVWWAVGWSVEARYVVFWRLGYQVDPLSPIEHYVALHGKRSNAEG